VAVEKLHFLQNSKTLGDRKCLGKLRKSFVAHPDTILFSRISGERVFQHPRLLTTVEPLACLHESMESIASFFELTCDIRDRTCFYFDLCEPILIARRDQLDSMLTCFEF